MPPWNHILGSPDSLVRFHLGGLRSGILDLTASAESAVSVPESDGGAFLPLGSDVKLAQRSVFVWVGLNVLVVVLEKGGSWGWDWISALCACLCRCMSLMLCGGVNGLGYVPRVERRLVEQGPWLVQRLVLCCLFRRNCGWEGEGFGERQVCLRWWQVKKSEGGVSCRPHSSEERRPRGFFGRNLWGGGGWCGGCGLCQQWGE